MDIAQITEYGSIGLAAALIFLIGFILRKVFCLFGNHIAHNTEATKDLTVVIAELQTWLKAKNGK